MNLLVKCSGLLLLLLLLAGCKVENDYIATNNRLGLIRIGDTPKKVSERFNNYQIEEFNSERYPQRKYYIISDGDDELIHVFFNNNYVAGVKAFDRRYHIDYSKLGFGDLWEPIMDSYVTNLFVETDEYGVVGNLNIKNNNRVYKAVPKVITKNKVYYKYFLYKNDGYYSVEAYLIGRNFDISKDIKSEIELEEDKVPFKSKVVGNEYVNDSFGLRFILPEKLILKEKYNNVDGVVELYSLENKDRTSILTTFVQTAYSEVEKEIFRTAIDWSSNKEGDLERSVSNVYRGIRASSKEISYTAVTEDGLYLFKGRYKNNKDLVLFDNLMCQIIIGKRDSN